MPLHFTEDELALRRRCTGLDGLLMFRQESMYYLKGYDITLLTRSPDLRQARYTSIVGDIRIWCDRDGAK